VWLFFFYATISVVAANNIASSDARTTPAALYSSVNVANVRFDVTVSSVSAVVVVVSVVVVVVVVVVVSSTSLVSTQNRPRGNATHSRRCVRQRSMQAQPSAPGWSTQCAGSDGAVVVVVRAELLLFGGGGGGC
jgi:lipopolysaccharide/colanic/teichoic acid biosynthesis glycosyltransferase